MSPPRENPFASLAKLRDALPEGAAKTPEAQRTDALPPARGPFSGKIVLAKTRKGRGGRTVTVVSGLRTDAAGREAICRELKKALGCGATVEEEQLVVAGDIADRIARWLEGKGATNVVFGT